jgi:hypothetical protein
MSMTALVWDIRRALDLEIDDSLYKTPGPQAHEGMLGTIHSHVIGI